MKFSPFDFDVVSGPPEPREVPPRPAAPAGTDKKEGAKETTPEPAQ